MLLVLLCHVNSCICCLYLRPLTLPLAACTHASTDSTPGLSTRSATSRLGASMGSDLEVSDGQVELEISRQPSSDTTGDLTSSSLHGQEASQTQTTVTLVEKVSQDGVHKTIRTATTRSTVITDGHSAPKPENTASQVTGSDRSTLEGQGQTEGQQEASHPGLDTEMVSGESSPTMMGSCRLVYCV